jgi:hypothetical protein
MDEKTKPSYEERRITKHSASPQIADSASDDNSSKAATENRESNMYGCEPCPKCHAKFRYTRKGQIICDDCGHTEPVAADTESLVQIRAVEDDEVYGPDEWSSELDCGGFWDGDVFYCSAAGSEECDWECPERDNIGLTAEEIEDAEEADRMRMEAFHAAENSRKKREADKV